MRAKLEDVIEQVVRDQFSRDAVESVAVDRTLDDGERAFKIVVVCGKNFSRDDDKKMLGLVRHIRSALRTHESEINDFATAFPIVDFLSASDAAKMKRELA